MSYLLVINIFLIMHEENTDQSQPQTNQNPKTNSQLISIRKKLIAPNNILPASMIRSQLPQHIFSLQSSHNFQSGQNLLLENCDMSVDLQMQKSKGNGSISGSPRVKGRSKSDISSFRRRQKIYLEDGDRNEVETLGENDPLRFLDRNIKNLLEKSHNIVFISRTAFLNISKHHKFTNKNHIHASSPQSQRKQNIINHLKQNKNYGCTTYAFDQSKNMQEDRSVNQSINYDDDLEFGDQFQSSNLYLAYKIEDQIKVSERSNKNYYRTYLLTVRLDYNTKSYGQWFYFKVKRQSKGYSFSRTRPNLYKFLIINMTKNSSLFGKGLKVSVCRKGIWGKQGTSIKYYKNSLVRQETKDITQFSRPTQNYYTLQFILQLDEQQQIYVSYNQPYSYSRMGKLIDRISMRFQQNPKNIINFKRNVLCNTYLSNNIEVLTFSSRKSAQPLHLSLQQKKIIYIMGRAHPIQTAGSHVIQGILQQIFHLFIQHCEQQSKQHIIYKLLQQYIIKIIPMINPDGVILGNSRCNLAGYDLNRCWKSPKPQKSKQITHIKKHIFQHHNRIQMFIDLHAHSKKKNVFAYGCHDISNPYSTRQFPFLLSKLSKNDFLFQQCKFTKLSQLKQQVSQKKTTKDGTARIFLYDSLRIPNIFTIQNSYCSAKDSPFHYDKYSYGVIGADILKAIALYFSHKYKQDQELMVHKNQQQLYKKCFMSKNKIKIEVNAPFSNDLQLKLTINSQDQRVKMEEINRYSNPVQMRSQYLQELREKKENINIGILSDLSDQGSESQEENRIYQAKKKKKAKMHSEVSLSKVKGESKTDRNMKEKGKCTVKPSPDKSQINKRSLLHVSHISSTHSQTNLAKLSKISKFRFNTINKRQDYIHETDHIGVTIAKDATEKHPFSYKKKRFHTQSNTSKIKKQQNCLSIVQIGLGSELPKNNLAQNLVIMQRFQAKQRLKTFHGFKDQNNNQQQGIKKVESTHKKLQVKDDEIKQYLRRIMKPKQVIEPIEKNERLFRIHEKGEKMEQKVRQSYLKINDLRLSRLVVLQANKKIKPQSQRMGFEDQ